MHPFLSLSLGVFQVIDASLLYQCHDLELFQVNLYVDDLGIDQQLLSVLVVGFEYNQMFWHQEQQRHNQLPRL